MMKHVLARNTLTCTLTVKLCYSKVLETSVFTVPTMTVPINKT